MINNIMQGLLVNNAIDDGIRVY